VHHIVLEDCIAAVEPATARRDRLQAWATHSRLGPMIDAAHTVKRHWDGILRWFDSKIANGLIEGIKSLVQAAKAKARGYRSIRNSRPWSICWLANSTCSYPREDVSTHPGQRRTLPVEQPTTP
jgi:hypothetical protein